MLQGMAIPVSTFKSLWSLPKNEFEEKEKEGATAFFDHLFYIWCKGNDLKYHHVVG
jgi:hypothetical protein